MNNEEQVIEKMNNTLKITTSVMEQVALTVKRLAEGFAKLLPRMQKEVCLMVLTPKQYHLLLHGRKRVKKKWLNVARKRIERLYKEKRAV